MKFKTAAFIIAALAVPTIASAQGVSDKSPGHEMQRKGSMKGTTGASGYAPGHEMQRKGSKRGTAGASGYAPGHSTTGSKSDGDHDRDDMNSR